MQANNTAAFGAAPSADRHIMTPGIPPNCSWDWAEATLGTAGDIGRDIVRDDAPGAQIPFSPRRRASAHARIRGVTCGDRGTKWFGVRAR